MSRTRTSVADRKKGAVLGAIIGDTLGATYEFEVPENIPAEPFNIVGGGPFGFRPGEGTDDTDLFLAAINAYEDGKFKDDRMVRNMIDWMKGEPADVGRATREAIYSWAQGKRPEMNSEVQGNGGLMRASAHGIMNVGNGPTSHSRAYKYAFEDTMLTHPSLTAARISGEYAEGVSKLIKGWSPEGVVEAVKAVDPYRWPVARGGGHCVHSYRLALWALNNYQLGFEDALSAVIATGGDTDTNGAIAGAMLGAALGINAIPDRWIDQLVEAGLVRIPAALMET